MQPHSFLLEKMSQKESKKESDNYMGLRLRSRLCQFFIQKFHVVQYVDFM